MEKSSPLAASWVAFLKISCCFIDGKSAKGWLEAAFAFGLTHSVGIRFGHSFAPKLLWRINSKGVWVDQSFSLAQSLCGLEISLILNALFFWKRIIKAGRA